MKSDGFYLGVNYWSREYDILMWRFWNLESICEDLDKLSDIGVNTLRIFILAEDFALPNGGVKKESLRKFLKFLDEAEKRKLKVFPSLLVGHMSGKNWPFPWDPEDIVYEPQVLYKTLRFISGIVEAARGHPAVAGWIISNEITHVRKTEDMALFRLWLEAIVRTIKSLDPGKPISLGDGTVPHKPLPVRPENVAEVVDYLSPHLYLYDDNPVRHGLTYMAILEYCLSLGKPTLLEEFGFPTNLYTEESHAGFIETILVGSYALQASGAFIWCAFDFPREEDEPYLWEPHELFFGIFRKDGSPKPAAEAVKRFSELLEILDWNSYELPEKEVKIVVPAVLYKRLPFTFENAADISKALVQAYVLAKQNGLNATFTREEKIDEGRLFIAPSLPRLLTSTWRNLLELVERGAVLYYSHARYLANPHVSSTHLWEELFGVKPSLKAGLRGVYRSEITLNLKTDRIVIPAMRKDIGSTGFVQIDAEILEEEIFFRAKRGKGMAFLMTYPIELYLYSLQDIGNAYKIYGFLAENTGLKPFYSPGSPTIQVEYWTKRGKPSILFLINHSYHSVKTATMGEKIWGRPRVEGDVVIMPPKSAAVFELI